jgi:tetratricopeptide (TPR) repeat protein
MDTIEYGKLARDQRDWQTAWDYFASVRDWFEQRVEQAARDEPLALSTWGHLAIVAYHLGRPQEAKELCLKGLEFFEQYGIKGYMATLKYRLALAEEALSENDAAQRHAKEALDWFERLGMKPDYAEALLLWRRLQLKPLSGPTIT